MKKIILSILFSFMTLFLLTSCGHTHTWGEVTYTWSNDNKTCTATRVCEDDESHKETETVNSNYEVIKESSCEENGTGRYTVVFENEAFSKQIKEVVIGAMNHDYQFVEFIWAENNQSAQVKLVCSRNSEHVAYCDATVTSEVTTEPGCQTEGVRTYTASYDNHTSTKTVSIDPAHKWGSPTYTWSEDYSTCTAKVVCTLDSEHVFEETANSTVSITATYETAGDITYSVTFESDLFSSQTTVKNERLITWDKIVLTAIDNGNSYKVSQGAAVTGVVSIPDTYNGKPVTLIDDYAFQSSGVTELYVGQNIQKIGLCAFDSCESLSKVVFVSQSNLDTLGKYAFCDCPISTITLPNGLHFIDEAVFYGCGNLTEIKYQGTMQEWKSGMILDNWVTWAPASTVTCTDGSVGVHEGTYWDDPVGGDDDDDFE